MAEPAGDYHRGEMDVHEQASTYSAFLTFSKWGSLALGVGILFFVLLFCTKHHHHGLCLTFSTSIV